MYSPDYESELDVNTDLYVLTFSDNYLRTRLQILRAKFCDEGTDTSSVKLSDEVEFVVHRAKSILSEVVKLIKLILLLPATNASSEWSFSALRSVKT